MQLREVMIPNVYVIRPDATLQEAAQQMKASHVGSLMVHGRASDRASPSRYHHTSRSGRSDPPPPSPGDHDARRHWCHEDADMTSAIQLMKDKQIRHLVIGDEQQNLVGIVSLYALALRTGDETLAGTAIRWPA